MTDTRTGRTIGPIPCENCGQPIHPDKPAFRVTVFKRRKAGRRWFDNAGGIGFVCESCFDTDEFHLIGRTAIPVTPSRTGRACEGCGRLVVLGKDPCRTGVYCTPACKSTAWRNRTRDISANDSSCVVCGTPMPDARSDRQTCSSACRQKAYRARRTTGSQAVTRHGSGS